MEKILDWQRIAFESSKVIALITGGPLCVILGMALC